LLHRKLSIFKTPVVHFGPDKMRVLTEDVRRTEMRMQSDDHLFKSEVLFHSIQILLLDFMDVYARTDDVVSTTTKHIDVISHFMRMLYEEDFVKYRRLEYYADKLHVTPKYLSEVLRKFTGKGASYWINRFTTNKLRTLLRSTTLSFSEIADMFCFSSPAHFYVYFQKQVGMSPSEYRNAQKGA
jgi:AraC family transcriptional activator of pobA